MKALFLAICFVTLIPFCAAQSGGGGGGGVTVFAVFLSPFLLCVMCYLCIHARCEAKKEKRAFFDELHPASCPTVICVGPRDGTYVGSFEQGYLEYYMEVDLQFTEKAPLVQGNIRLFKVSGKGEDKMGKFKLTKGECQLGKTGRIFFRKKYISMNSGYKEDQMHPLIYKGEMASDDVGSIRGEWKFAALESSEDFPDVSGTFKLKLESPVSQQEAIIELPVESHSINLEKTPLLQTA